MNTVTVRLKDKLGVRLINLDPTQRYVMLISKDNAESLFRNPAAATSLMKELGLSYIFVAVDINKLTIQEKEQFARFLVEGAPKDEKKEL